MATSVARIFFTAAPIYTLMYVGMYEDLNDRLQTILQEVKSEVLACALGKPGSTHLEIPLAVC